MRRFDDERQEQSLGARETLVYFLFIGFHRPCIETYGITCLTEHETNYDSFREIPSPQLRTGYSRGKRISAASFLGLA